MNKIKTFLKQLFCKHENCSWYYKQSDYPFLALNGKRIYLICDKCGKETLDIFVEN